MTKTKVIEYIEVEIVEKNKKDASIGHVGLLSHFNSETKSLRINYAHGSSTLWVSLRNYNIVSISISVKDELSTYMFKNTDQDQTNALVILKNNFKRLMTIGIANSAGYIHIDRYLNVPDDYKKAISNIREKSQKQFNSTTGSPFVDTNNKTNNTTYKPKVVKRGPFFSQRKNLPTDELIATMRKKVDKVIAGTYKVVIPTELDETVDDDNYSDKVSAEEVLQELDYYYG